MNDPLNSESEDEDMEGEEFEGFGDDAPSEKNEIIRLLEEQAASGAEKKDRLQSEREREWIERLVGKYGDDVGKMSRDRRLNPMQQTEADLKRRIGKWRSTGGAISTSS